MEWRWSATLDRFDSTYEGLKLVMNAVGRALAPCFDSTYEGLKRLQVLARLLGV